MMAQFINEFIIFLFCQLFILYLGIWFCWDSTMLACSGTLLIIGHVNIVIIIIIIKLINPYLKVVTDDFSTRRDSPRWGKTHLGEARLTEVRQDSPRHRLSSVSSSEDEARYVICGRCPSGTGSVEQTFTSSKEIVCQAPAYLTELCRSINEIATRHNLVSILQTPTAHL